MKNNKFKNLSALLLIFALTLNTQTILINNSPFDYDDALRPSLNAVVDPEVKLMKNAWDDYAKDNLGGVKLKNMGLFSKKNIQKAEGVLITSISEKPINLYSSISEKFDGTEVVVFA